MGVCGASGCFKHDASMTDAFVGSVQLFDALAAAVPDAYVDLLVKVLGMSRGASVLELGCGTGELARRVAGRGYNVDAVDQSRAMIERARKRPEPAVRLFNANVSSFRFEQSSYDAIFSFEAFHLFPNRAQLVRRLRDASRPNARLGIGWRLASWEDNHSTIIRAQFERYGVAFGDWAHWLCADLDLSLGENWTKPEVFRLEVKDRTTVAEAVDFICSIHRFSKVPKSARSVFRRELDESLRDAALGRTAFSGVTTYGITVTQRLP